MAAPDSPGFDIAAFLREATHEIANPLNAISMNAELAKLLLQRDQAPRAIEVLDRLLTDCGRCGRVLHSVQRFGSNLKLQGRDTVQARVLIDSAIATFSQEFPSPQPAWRVDAIEQSVCVSRAAMERVIVGLFLNAVQAGATSIEIQARRDANSILIDISDNGPGIPAEIRSRVTEPFFTTHRAEGRSGLGLTLADALLRAHGGDLQVEENDTGGVRVILRLPETPDEQV